MRARVCKALGCKQSVHHPRFKVDSQPLRALCFPRSRYRRNRLPLHNSKGTAPHAPTRPMRTRAANVTCLLASSMISSVLVARSWRPHSRRRRRRPLRSSRRRFSSCRRRFNLQSPAAVIAASALALPDCPSPAAPAAPAAAQSTGLGGRIPAAAAASEDPATSSVSAPYSAPSRSASAVGPCMVAPGEASAPVAVDKPSRPIASPAVAFPPPLPPPKPPPHFPSSGRDKVVLRTGSRFRPAKDMRDETMRAHRG